MKAVINGIEVEGTPDEIIEYQRLNDLNNHKKAYQNLSTGGTAYLPWMEMMKLGVPVYISYYDTE